MRGWWRGGLMMWAVGVIGSIATAAPRVEDNPYVEAARRWQALPDGLKDAVREQRWAEVAPVELTDVWAAMDRGAVAGELAWWPEDMRQADFALLPGGLRGMARARLALAADGEETVQAFEAVQALTRQMRTDRSLIGALVRWTSETAALEALGRSAAELSPAQAARLAAAGRGGPTECTLADMWRWEHAALAAPLRQRFEAWKNRVRASDAAEDWTTDYEVTGLGDLGRGEWFVSLQPRSAGPALMVWRDRPAGGIALLRVDVARDRAVLVRGGHEAEVRLSDRRWRRAGRVIGVEDMAVIGFEAVIPALKGTALDSGIDPETCTDVELEEYLAAGDAWHRWQVEFLERVGTESLSDEARAEYAKAKEEAGKAAASAVDSLRLHDGWMLARKKRALVTRLLEMRAAGEAWDSAAMEKAARELGAEWGERVDGRQKITLPGVGTQTKAWEWEVRVEAGAAR